MSFSSSSRSGLLDSSVIVTVESWTLRNFLTQSSYTAYQSKVNYLSFNLEHVLGLKNIYFSPVFQGQYKHKMGCVHTLHNITPLNGVYPLYIIKCETFVLLLGTTAPKLALVHPVYPFIKDNSLDSRIVKENTGNNKQNQHANLGSQNSNSVRSESNLRNVFH